MRGLLHVAAVNLLCVVGSSLLVLNDDAVLASFQKPLE
jgi:hypothetical protein